MIAINICYGYLKDIDESALMGQEKVTENNDEQKVFMVNENWYIEVSKINLKASIAEGVTIETLKENIGHYENSGLTNSNVCLKAFSSGNNVNFFENIKNLRAGDEIIYKKDEYKATYIVKFSGVIDYNDLSYLAQGEENLITLITNIENDNRYLRCVQGVKENL